MDLKISTHMIKNMIDIIVLTFNRINYIKAFVENLYLSTNYPFRINVIDNGSIDGSRDLIKKLKENNIIYRYSFNEKNLPLASALTDYFNRFKNELTDLFITVADDMAPPMFKDHDWLEMFVYKIKSDINIGCINFRAARCHKESFDRKVRPKVYDKLMRIDIDKYNRMKEINKILYE